MRIRPIRTRLFTLMMIRILLLWICDLWSTDRPGLHFEPPRLHCERPRIYGSILSLQNSLILTLMWFRTRIHIFTLMRIRIQLPKIMKIRIHNPAVTFIDFLCYRTPTGFHRTLQASVRRVSPSCRSGVLQVITYLHTRRTTISGNCSYKYRTLYLIKFKNRSPLFILNVISSAFSE